MIAMLVVVWLIASLGAALLAGRFIYEGEGAETRSPGCPERGR